MDLQLESKRAIITGGSQGIGLAIAHALAAEGVDIAIGARNEGRLRSAAEAVSARSGRNVVPIRADVTDDDSVKQFVADAVEALGGVDILVNNASNQTTGAGMPGLADTTDEMFWDDVNVKVVGYLRVARAVAPHLIEQGWGRIINISGLGYRQTLSIVRSIRNVSVVAFTKNLADELGPFGINVTVVHPGVTRTEKNSGSHAERDRERGMDIPEYDKVVADNAIRRIVTAEEVADVVSFLASPRSVAISGDSVAVGGGVLGTIHY